MELGIGLLPQWLVHLTTDNCNTLLSTTHDHRATIKYVSLNLLTMRPDYAHKVFEDLRKGFNLLMEALAMDGNHTR